MAVVGALLVALSVLSGASPAAAFTASNVTFTFGTVCQGGLAIATATVITSSLDPNGSIRISGTGFPGSPFFSELGFRPTTMSIEADWFAEATPLGELSQTGQLTIEYRQNGVVVDTATSNATFVATVVPDCEAPRMFGPRSPIQVAATSPAGANVDFSVFARDNLEPVLPNVTCSPPSGSVFPIGKTAVTCGAQDAVGNTGSTSFDVIVTKPAPPIFSAPPVIPPVEATSPAGAVVNWTGPTATDGLGNPLAVKCTAASGDTFPVGSTTINCSADDAFGQSATSDSFFVTVRDTTAPILPAQPPISVPATSASGATVNYPAPTASDIVDGSIPATCTPPSGSLFPLGDTTVTCTAQDKAGNPAAPTAFTVSVTNTPPTLTVPGNLTAEATGPGGAPVSFAATATDTEDGTAPVLCTPASGSTFALGATKVDCTAKDSGGLTATGSFAVTVRDTAAPTVTVPANISVAPTGASGAVVTWPAATATDIVSGSLPTTCTPASGATFAAGTTTTVTCTATDGAGNTGTSEFTVTVQPFTFKGFFDDLKACQPGVVVCNTVKGGSSRELEFRVFAGATELTATNVIRSITQTPVSCTTGAATGPAQTLATTGLKYDREDAKFEYKWTVPRTGTCWQVTVTNTSGSSLSAVVKLKS